MRLLPSESGWRILFIVLLHPAVLPLPDHLSQRASRHSGDHWPWRQAIVQRWIACYLPSPPVPGPYHTTTSLARPSI